MNAGLVFLTTTCLSYLVFMEIYENIPIAALLFAAHSLSLLQFVRALVVGSPVMPLVEVAFLVARLEYASVLHHHAQSSGEAQRQQQVLHGRRQYFGGLHFPAKLAEVRLLIRIIRMTGHCFLP